MNWSKIRPFTAAFAILISACTAETSSLVQTDDALATTEATIAGIRTHYAPDKRVALFNISTERSGEYLVLRGESDMPEAVDSLKAALNANSISYLDSIQLLPDASLEGNTYGIVTLSVANLRSDPQHSAELSTQATMGTPLKVLKKKGGWYLVQTPDKYLAWVDDGGLVRLGKSEFQRWQNAEKLIYLKPYGFSYEGPAASAATLSDLVAGSILELESEEKGFYRVRYPDGTTAYVAKAEAQPYEAWLAALNPSGSSLIKTAFTLKGLPYLWGGTSSKGMDCSGFTKTVFFLNGLVIPRDASQQIHTGQLIDSTGEFDKLLPGDLLFFGRAATDSTAERVVHVGMWIGNGEFIHSAGKVRISSVDSSADHFDEYNYNRYLRTKRLLHQQDPKLIQLKEENIF